MGNITHLERRGTVNVSGTSLMNGLMDNLNYAYDGNQLTAVQDIADGTTGFVDGASSNYEYTYDANGNVTRDDNKDIVITYNHLNLPKQIQFARPNANIVWLYNAAGQKVQKTVTDASNVVTNKHYIGNVQYINTEVDFIQHQEGRIIRNLVGIDIANQPIYDYRYEYSLKDHLGNGRVFFSDMNKDGIVDVAQNGNPNELLQQEHYYPFGMGIKGEWKFVQPQIGGTNLEQFNGIELNDDFGLNWNMAEYRSYDPSIGKWSGVDPEAEMYYSWNSYNMALGNPLKNSDPSGATVVDPNGNPVGISFDENNKLLYAFSDKYSDKKRAKVEKQFMKETAPVLDVMAQTEQGREDIETLNTMSTEVKISFSEDASSEVNSWVFYGRTQEDGYYDGAEISPFFGNHKATGSKSDFNEWLGAVMTVEVGHLEKDQVKLDTEAKNSNRQYLYQPNSKEFQKSYEPLLNRATEYRIKYRKANNIPLTKEVFAPLDKYKIRYNDYNKKAKESLNK